jgi:hypothetical protein
MVRLLSLPNLPPKTACNIQAANPRACERTRWVGAPIAASKVTIM